MNKKPLQQILTRVAIIAAMTMAAVIAFKIGLKLPGLVLLISTLVPAASIGWIAGGLNQRP